MLAAVLLATAAVPTATAQQTDPSRINAGGGPHESFYTLPELTVFGTRLFGPYSVFQITASCFHLSARSLRLPTSSRPDRSGIVPGFG